MIWAMPPVKTYAEARFAILYCGALGLVIPLWVITTYAHEDDLRAIVVSLLIMGGFAFGIYWLWYYAAQFAAHERELRSLDASQPVERQLDKLPPGLGRVVLERLHGGRPVPNGALGTFIPYLIGALVLLGLIGTFIGLVDTLRGTRVALETTSELEALRSSLLAPIAGLARAFGTSLSGVATSLILGLCSTLTRRAEIRLNHSIALLCPGPQSPLHPVTRQTAALEDLVEQGVAMPKLIAEFRASVGELGKTFEAGRLGQERLGNRIADLISEQVGILRGDLGSELKRFSDHLEPALQGLLAHAVGLLDHTGHDLVAKVQARLEDSASHDQERRSAFLDLLESERKSRGSEEIAHFERLATHTRMLSDALHGHVQSVAVQYSNYLTKLEERMAAFDEAWRTDSAGRRQHQEVERRAFETHLEGMRQRFTGAFEDEARRHQALLESMAGHYRDLVARFGQESSALAAEAAKAVVEISALHAGILEKHEADREQLRKAWGIEQGRQQRQFDSLLEKMREDLDDRRRTGTEQVSNLNAWAHQLVKRLEVGVADKAVSWEAQFGKLIAALAETAETMRRGERARAQEFREIAQVIAEADRHRGEELRRLIGALREPHDGARPPGPQ